MAHGGMIVRHRFNGWLGIEVAGRE
uniref:Uncharacterized protein n=1 Tax=Candidatus Nitrotoga fabula TaxID=2182327 RepID=A0A2X0QTN1_9PROT|nr:protein of unknown function [Candidatus Nitrotoga fabula]